MKVKLVLAQYPLYDLDVRGDALVSGTTALVGDVAIGSSSSGTLTANKNVYLKTVATAPASNISQLVIDNTSGEIYAVRGVAEDSKAFSYIRYTLTTGNNAGDWIKDFNTMIPTDAYTVIVVGSAFNVNSSIGLKPSSVLISAGATYTGQSVYAFEVSGTWRLTADYVSGSTTDGSSGIWNIYCLIINKSIVNILSPQIKTLQNGNTGTGTKPGGL